MPLPINISASRGAGILGISRYENNTPVNNWLQIMETRQPGFCERNGYTFPVFEESAAIRWGKAFESAVIELAENRSQDKIKDREYFYSTDNKSNWFFGESPIDYKNDKYFDKNNHFITCHIDGQYSVSGDLHEGKTTSLFYHKDNFGEDGSDRVPIEYQIQCQHQMICTGAEKVILSLLVFPRRTESWEDEGIELHEDNEGHVHIMKIKSDREKNAISSASKWARTLSQMGYFHQYEIKADPDLQAEMIKYYTDFWNNHILTGIPPRPEGYEDIKLLVREPAGTIIASDYITSLSREHKDIKKEISGTGDLAKRAAWCKVKILDYMRKTEKTLDDDSEKKWILVDNAGEKLNQYNGKSFR
jgi:predicted phage-related endonuclease